MTSTPRTTAFEPFVPSAGPGPVPEPPVVGAPAPLPVPDLFALPLPVPDLFTGAGMPGNPVADASWRRPVPKRLAAALAVAAALVLLVAGAVATVVGPSPTTGHRVLGLRRRGHRQPLRAGVHPSLNLPPATSAPAPAPPSVAAAAPLQSHEVFGYAPYWTLPSSSRFDVADLTTLAYFSVDANADGSLDQSGPGGTATRARTWSTW